MVPVLLVALATALRLSWVLLVPTKPVGDFSMYLESAAHVVQHGALDPEFVYMPGYVLLLAAVQALGGGVLAAKIVGALLAGAATGAIYGIAHALWDRRAAMAAAALYAIWPAGIAVTSVTGTDLPTAVVVTIAGWCLVRRGETRPARAALLFGLVMGLAAWMRAVALPLAALSAVYFRARGGTWRQTAARTGLACAAAALVLLPWAIRNRLRYGEAFVTDSHGGLTALVGANPDTDGAYSRSLNRMFLETTGYYLLREPHRQSDRAAYEIARRWTRFEPAYAAGLVGLKGERLLGSEAPLLYWPLFREGVLRAPYDSWFQARRRGLERFADGFWIFLAVAAAAGLGLAVGRRSWPALAFVPLQLALLGIYALFFAEARYQLPIVMLLFPPAGAALAWASAGKGSSPKSDRRRDLIAAAAGIAVVFAGWFAATAIAAKLREDHRWAAHVCHVEGRAQLCQWRRDDGAGPSPIRGVWDGFGLTAGGRARAELVLPPGRRRVEARLDLAPVAAADGSVTFAAGAASTTLSRAQLATESRAGRTLAIALDVEHPGGPLVLRLSSAGAGPRVWLSDLQIEAR
jgi:4-amino-4-deoxy-L-arabinose transferase-like glycosyltransferase